jgi:hypothetical protein
VPTVVLLFSVLCVKLEISLLWRSSVVEGLTYAIAQLNISSLGLLKQYGWIWIFRGQSNKKLSTASLDHSVTNSQLI